MRRKINMNLFFCAFLAISLIFIEGCSKKENSLDVNNKTQLQTVKVKNNSTPYYNDLSIVKRVQVNEMKNVQLKEVMDDKGEILKNGVYGCISRDEGNYYIFINGVDYWYSNLSFNINDKLLTIKYDTKYEEGLRVKQLFLIVPKNAESFEKVELINNGNKEAFKILFQN